MTFLPVAHSLLAHGGNDKHDPSLQTYVAETLREHPRPGSNSNGQAVAFDWQAGAPQSDNDQSGGKGRKWIVRAGDYTGALGETRRDAVGGPEIGVRRLTPTECERLQAFPDGWTQLGNTADSKRYSALGDAVTVNVAHWIGSRLPA